MIAMYINIISCFDGAISSMLDYQCWTLSHDIHSIFGAIYAIILLCITMPTASMYFDKNPGSCNVYSEISSKADVSHLIFRATLAIIMMIFSEVFYCII